MEQWSEADLLHEVFAEPRSAFGPNPDTRVIERPGWFQLVTPTFTRGGLNGVSLSVLDESDADGIIDAVIAEYQLLGLRFTWAVPPGSRPRDLAERLARRGLRRREARGMYRRTSENPRDVGPDIAVHEVDDALLVEFTRVMAEGWALDPAPLLTYHQRVLAEPKRRHRMFLASIGGAPAATAALALFERSAYFLGAVVLPRFRGRGAFRALTAARLRFAAQRGITLATCQAREETSAPLLERIGFGTLCRFPSFSND